MLKSEFAVKKVIKISKISLESHCITAISQIDELDSRNCNYLKKWKNKRERKGKIDNFQVLKEKWGIFLFTMCCHFSSSDHLIKCVQLKWEKVNFQKNQKEKEWKLFNHCIKGKKRVSKREGERESEREKHIEFSFSCKEWCQMRQKVRERKVRNFCVHNAD